MKTRNFEDYCPFGGSKCWISGGFSHNLGEPIHTKQETEELEQGQGSFGRRYHLTPPPPKVWCCLLALMMVGTVQGHLGLKSWTSSCWTDLTKGFSFTKPANISSKVGGIWDQQPAEVFIFPSSFNTCFKTYSCLLCLLFHFFLVVCRFKHDNMCCLLTRYLLITFYIAA